MLHQEHANTPVSRCILLRNAPSCRGLGCIVCSWALLHLPVGEEARYHVALAFGFVLRFAMLRVALLQVGNKQRSNQGNDLIFLRNNLII